jgi:hypothetical protein
MPTYRGDRWTQDSVWYNFQPVLQKHGITVTRETVKRLIRVVCAKLGVSRESLGFFTWKCHNCRLNGDKWNIKCIAVRSEKLGFFINV